MMSEPVVLGFFCEDIREEKRGTDSLVGVFPDNINVPGFPGAMPKLALYVRSSLDVSASINPYRIELVRPDGERMVLSELTTEFIEKTQRQARERGMPRAGVVTKVVMDALPITKPGLLKAVIVIGGDEQIIAALNFSGPATAKPASAV